MKILQVVTISDTLNSFLIPHLKSLANQGHEIHLACKMEEPFLTELKRYPHYEIPFSRRPLAKTNYQALRQLKELLEKEKFDVIHTHTPNASALVRLAAKKTKSKVVYTAHGFHFYKNCSPLKKVLFHTAEKWLAHATDHLITINQEDYQAAQKFSLKKGGKVHYLAGIGTDIVVSKNQKKVRSLKKRLNLMPQDFVLLFAAELSKRKNQSFLIEVMHLLQQKGYSHLKLLLLGEGPQEITFKKQVKKLNLEEQIFFEGYQQELHPYLELADLVVSPSKQEGLPVNIMEALAYGKPVVATKIRGHVDLLAHPMQGILVETKEEMVEAILQVKNQPERFSPVLDEKFSVTSSVSAMEKIYEEIGGKEHEGTDCFHHYGNLQL